MKEKTNVNSEILLSSISSILIEVDRNDIVKRWNKAAEIAFSINRDIVLGKSFIEIEIYWDWLEVITQINECRDKDEFTQISDIVYLNGEKKERYLNLTINPLIENNEKKGYVLLGLDITEQKIIESQLLQAQKLESIGQLAAGIAHEINTPLQYINDNTKFLKDSFKDIVLVFNDLKNNKITDLNDLNNKLKSIDIDFLIDEIPEAINQTIDGISNVVKIVRAMKDFSHPGQSDMQMANINKAIENTMIVSKNEWKYVADIQTELNPTVPNILCHAGEINQVFLNIIINAAHAIEEKFKNNKNGLIKISSAFDAGYVIITISDNGTGIPKEIINNVFDPFFTTKSLGKGTGQGLSIAYNVITEMHEGKLLLETEDGIGTKFIIKLPLRTK
jgi:PAS domain S-box-containing protein